MIVISDASPLNILVRIGHIGLLPTLFGRVIVPGAVASELSRDNTPPVVRDWLAQKPEWLEIRAPIQIDNTLQMNDAGECEAISLALEVRADVVLIDDLKARRIAVSRGLAVTGVVGVLELAVLRGLVPIGEVLASLRSTDFRIAETILQAAEARVHRSLGVDETI